METLGSSNSAGTTEFHATAHFTQFLLLAKYLKPLFSFLYSCTNCDNMKDKDILTLWSGAKQQIFH